jgi:hypothetical protein
MELYIRLADGQPVDHPILGDNFRQAFPDIDTSNLPAEFAQFERIQPNPGKYEVVVGNTYQFVDSVVKDVWEYRPMTDEERAAVDAAELATTITAPGTEPNVIG